MAHMGGTSGASLYQRQPQGSWILPPDLTLWHGKKRITDFS